MYGHKKLYELLFCPLLVSKSCAVHEFMANAELNIKQVNSATNMEKVAEAIR